MKKAFVTAALAALLVLALGLTAAAEQNLTAHLERIADAGDGIAYTVSMTDYGPLEPGDVDPEPYTRLLLDMKLEPADLSEQPEGEYVVLGFEEENLYYYFFLAEGGENLILQTDGEENSELFRAVPPEGRADASGVMQAWYETLADAQGIATDEPETVPQESRAFEGQWSSEDAGVEIFIEDGGFKAAVEETVAYPEGVRWEYALQYDPATKTLESVSGCKFAISFEAEGGSDILETLSEDESATFLINGAGRLVWTDHKADEGKGIEFVNVGTFAGTDWACNGASLEIFLEDVDTFKVLIRRPDGERKESEWVYGCRYDPETRQLFAERVVCDEIACDDRGEENRTCVYERDSEAVFGLNGAGCMAGRNTGEAWLDDLPFEPAPQDGPVAALAAAPLLGGWQVAESQTVDDGRRALFERATEGLLGVRYEPVAYLASQVVAGCNHCFLCRSTVIYPGAAPALKLVYVYEKPDGTAELLNIADLDIAGKAFPID